MTIEIALEALKVGGLPLAALLAVLFGIKHNGADKESDQNRIDKTTTRVDAQAIDIEKIKIHLDDHGRRLERLEK